MAGPPTIDGVDAPLLPIWSAAQPVLVLPPSSRPGHAITPPTPPIPPRGPSATPVGGAGTDTIEIPFEDEAPIEPEPTPVKTAKAK